MRYTPDAATALVLGAYLVGSIPFGVLVGRLKGVDPRTVGSGNIGMTNVWRALGPKLGITVFLLDVLKGFVPVWVAMHVPKHDGSYQQSAWAMAVVLAAAVAVFAGHNWPVFLGFKGGKGVATGLGLLLALDWRVALADWAGFFLLLGLTRYVSVASATAAVTLPFWFWFFTRGKPGSHLLVILGAVLGSFVVYKHRGNFRRLAQGTEPKIGAKRGGHR